MQYSISKIAFIAALAAPLAAAQTVTIADLPSCALQPGITALAATGCSISDIGCACKDQTFITSLTATVDQVCSAADIATTITVAQELCQQAGVSIVLPAPSSTAAPASSSAVPASSSSVLTTTGTSTSTAVAVVSTTTSVAASSSAATTTPVAVGTGNIASNKTVSTAAATSSAFTGAAAVATAMSGPLAAGGIFGVAALLFAL